MDLGEAGDRPQERVPDARLRRRSDRHRVAVAAEPGGDPDDVDVADRRRALRLSAVRGCIRRHGHASTWRRSQHRAPPPSAFHRAGHGGRGRTNRCTTAICTGWLSGLLRSIRAVGTHSLSRSDGLRGGWQRTGYTRCARTGRSEAVSPGTPASRRSRLWHLTKRETRVPGPPVPPRDPDGGDQQPFAGHLRNFLRPCLLLLVDERPT